MKSILDENQQGWIYYAAFDDSDAYRNLQDSFNEIGISGEGDYLVCPDGVARMVVEVKKEMYKQLESVLIAGRKTVFMRMIKRTRDHDFEILPTAMPTSPRTSRAVEKIILGSSLLRRHQRNKARANSPF